MLKDYVYVVNSAPIAGREDEYNRWYTERHLGDVLALPGFVSAQRFRMTDQAAGSASTTPYLALYFMRTDDPEGLLATLTNLVETGRMHMSEAFDQDNVATILYEAITPPVIA